MSLKRILFYIFSISCFFIGAQENIIFEHITSEQGLSQNDVNGICQDKEGFLWFATHDGLNKYNGYTFETFRPNVDNESSISSNLIYRVYGFDDGYIWMINTSIGISRLDPSTETFLNFSVKTNDKSSGLSNSYINHLLLDAEKKLWIGTKYGIDILDTNKLPESNEFSHFKINEEDVNAPENEIVTIFQDNDENIWIGTAAGVYRAFKNSKGKLAIIDATTELGLPAKTYVKDIISNKTGDILFSTRSGLFIKKIKKSKVEVISELPLLRLAVDEDNNLFAGGSNGLFFFKNDTVGNVYKLKNHFKNNIKNPFSINRNGVRSIFIDSSNIIWIGTKGGGINKMNPKGIPFRTLKSDLNDYSLSYNNIRSIYKDSNRKLWVGTEDGGLNVSLKEVEKNGAIEFMSFPKIKNIFSIEEIDHLGKKYLLFGSELGGVKKVSLKKGSYKLTDIETIEGSPIAAFSIAQTKNKDIWFGTYSRGLHKWTPIENGAYIKKNLTTENTNLNSNTIRSVFEDSKENIWVATSKGLHLLTAQEREKEYPVFKIYERDGGVKGSISHNYILSIHETKDGVIWAGTFGGGLNKLIPATANTPAYFKVYNEKNGFPNGIIKAIEEDEQGNLWVSSNKGLSRFNPKTETVDNYDVYDGLQGNEFLELSSFKCKDGMLLFGGINGMNIFNPEKILKNKIQARPLLINLLFPNKKIQIGAKYNDRILLEKTLNDTQAITLKPNENSFAIEFAASHTVAPNKNRFKYKLEGFDSDWIATDAKDRYAKYTNLRSGDYTFRLKASNNDGLWSSEEKTLKIKVIPPFYNSVWAYLIYALLIAALLIAFRRNTIIRAREKHQFDVGKMEKEKSEELQQMKLEFFTNISHEFRTPLTLIKGPLDYLEKKDDEITSEERKSQYQLMKKNANYLLRLVNQLLDFRRLDREKMKLSFMNLNIVDFIEETSGPFLFLANKKKINFTVKAVDKNIVLPIDADALEKILNNLLFNAFKFTPENHSVTVEIHSGKDFKNPKIFNKTLDLSEYVVVQIKDTGKGIKPEKLEHIFERYYVEKKQNVQGAGIGLSFTKSLVELHEGIITVQSKLGEGTVFSVLLPLNRDDLTHGNIIELEKEIELSENEATGNLVADINTLTGELKADVNKVKPLASSKKEEDFPKLLIIEDNEDIRTFVKQGIGNQYAIIEANNGQEGFDLAISEMPNLILSDIMMPVMDGLEMSRKLKADEKTSHIPIILLTAKSSVDTEREALGIEVDDFIRKPFDLDVLALKINNIMTKRSMLREKYKSTISLEPSEVTVTSVDERFIKKAMGIVEEHMMNTEFSVEMLVAEMGMSRSNLYLKLKEITGFSSSEFIRSVRLKRAVQLIKKSDLSVKEIMYMTGFNTASYFSKCFKKQYGMVPSEYVKSLKKEKEDLSSVINNETKNN